MNPPKLSLSVNTGRVPLYLLKIIAYLIKWIGRASGTHGNHELTGERCKHFRQLQTRPTQGKTQKTVDVMKQPCRLLFRLAGALVATCTQQCSGSSEPVAVSLSCKLYMAQGCITL